MARSGKGFIEFFDEFSGDPGEGWDGDEYDAADEFEAVDDADEFADEDEDEDEDDEDDEDSDYALENPSIAMIGLGVLALGALGAGAYFYLRGGSTEAAALLPGGEFQPSDQSQPAPAPAPTTTPAAAPETKAPAAPPSNPVGTAHKAVDYAKEFLARKSITAIPHSAKSEKLIDATAASIRRQAGTFGAKAGETIWVVQLKSATGTPLQQRIVVRKSGEIAMVAM